MLATVILRIKMNIKSLALFSSLGFIELKGLGEG